MYPFLFYMNQSIICYTLGDIYPKRRLKFNQELYGYTCRSHHGRYEYKREGILSNKEYKKPLDATLILPTNTAQKVMKHLRNYKAKYISYRIL